MLYYLTIIFQVFCIYHVFKNRNNYYWYFIIFFVPVLGCLVYLFTQILNKKDIEHIGEELTTIVNPTKKIKDLEQKLAFSETFQNRINLAEAFFENKEYKNAINHFEIALKDGFKDDAHTINTLIICYYFDKNYEQVIQYSNKINLDKNFQNTVYFYGLSLEKTGNLEAAEIQLKKVDKRYSNYDQRLVLAKFLMRQNKNKEATEVLNDILQEGQNMTKINLKKYKNVLVEAKRLVAKF